MNDTRRAIALLSALRLPLDNAQRMQIRLPDHEGQMRGIQHIFLNDCCGAQIQEASGDVLHAANTAISQEMAHNLQLLTLSDLRLSELDEEDTDDFSQNVDLIATIRATLKEYDIAYSYNEFLANADDANATEVCFMIDERLYEPTSLLAPTMSEFSQRPALLIFNNSTFSAHDLDGLRSINRGSKQDEPQKIGRLGLGALSMYHWTDLPNIVTAESILWLDPSKRFLPKYRDRRSRAGLHKSIASIYRYMYLLAIQYYIRFC